MRTKAKPRSEKKSDRVRLEREFLSSILADIDVCDIRQEAAGYGISWRRFLDRRHQALWRAVETLDLAAKTEERIDALIAEGGSEAVDGLGAVKKLAERSGGPEWLEHELAAAGLLRAVGGKVYLREVVGAYAVGIACRGLAARLGFVRGDGDR